jgi:hypothetical protein
LLPAFTTRISRHSSRTFSEVNFLLPPPLFTCNKCSASHYVSLL